MNRTHTHTKSFKRQNVKTVWNQGELFIVMRANQTRIDFKQTKSMASVLFLWAGTVLIKPMSLSESCFQIDLWASLNMRFSVGTQVVSLTPVLRPYGRAVAGTQQKTSSLRWLFIRGQASRAGWRPFRRFSERANHVVYVRHNVAWD